MRLSKAHEDRHPVCSGAGEFQPTATAVPLGEQAYKRLRNDIVQCLLLPGAEVTEAELAAKYELGKAPVRVALTRLTQDGLIRPVPRRGYVVAPITIKDVQDLFDMRAVIEPVLCRSAVGRLNPETLRRMEDPPKGSHDPEKRGEHLEWNQRFHTFFASGSGNKVGTDMLAELLRQATRVIYLGLYAGGMQNKQTEAGRRASRQEHKDMIGALARGDADEVERLVRKHVETSRRLVLDALLHGRSIVRV
jgi:DNA-binding GntR family transcriptional regulator